MHRIIDLNYNKLVNIRTCLWFYLNCSGSNYLHKNKTNLDNNLELNISSISGKINTNTVCHLHYKTITKSQWGSSWLGLIKLMTCDLLVSKLSEDAAGQWTWLNNPPQLIVTVIWAALTETNPVFEPSCQTSVRSPDPSGWIQTGWVFNVTDFLFYNELSKRQMCI